TGDRFAEVIGKVNLAVNDDIEAFRDLAVMGWTWTTNLSPNRTRLTEDQFLRLWRLGVTHLIVVSMRRWRRFDKIGVRSHPLRWRAIHRIGRNAIRAEFGISVIKNNEMHRLVRRDIVVPQSLLLCRFEIFITDDRDVDLDRFTGCNLCIYASFF